MVLIIRMAITADAFSPSSPWSLKPLPLSPTFGASDRRIKIIDNVHCNHNKDMLSRLQLTKAYIDSSSSGPSSSKNDVMSFLSSLPPPPELKILPLPIVLAGGIFLFGTSVKSSDKQFAATLMKQVEPVLRYDPTVSMELGQGIETGGIYSSVCVRDVPLLKSPLSLLDDSTQGTSNSEVDQIMLQFQITGGNAWAQGIVYGIRESNNNVRMVSLEVANMDAVMNGRSFSVPINFASQ